MTLRLHQAHCPASWLPLVICVFYLVVIACYIYLIGLSPPLRVRMIKISLCSELLEDFPLLKEQSLSRGPTLCQTSSHCLQSLLKFISIDWCQLNPPEEDQIHTLGLNSCMTLADCSLLCDLEWSSASVPACTAVTFRFCAFYARPWVHAYSLSLMLFSF